MKKIFSVASIFGIVAMLSMTGCSTKEQSVKKIQCGDGEYLKDGKCIPVAIKKLGTVTKVECKKEDQNNTCTVQRLYISLENGLDITADQDVKNRKSYAPGDIIEIVIPK